MEFSSSVARSGKVRSILSHGSVLEVWKTETVNQGRGEAPSFCIRLESCLDELVPIGFGFVVQTSKKLKSTSFSICNKVSFLRDKQFL